MRNDTTLRELNALYGMYIRVFALATRGWFRLPTLEPTFNLTKSYRLLMYGRLYVGRDLLTQGLCSNYRRRVEQNLVPSSATPLGLVRWLQRWSLARHVDDTRY